jgi:hypothetical protein
MRGTAATRFYKTGFTKREIAGIMDWEEESVSRIIRRYVGRNAAIKERIRRLDQALDQAKK